MDVTGAFVRDVLNPGMLWCQGLAGWDAPFSPNVRVGLAAIAGQESGWTRREQANGGPARGLWQFERGGGVRGVLYDDACRAMALRACADRHVIPDAAAVWSALARDDMLALAWARLLLWSDKRPCPDDNDEDGWWEYYLANWRPGEPRDADWPAIFTMAREAVI